MINKHKKNAQAIVFKIPISIIVWGLLLLLFSMILVKISSDANLIAPQLAFIGTAFIMVAIFEKMHFLKLGFNRVRFFSFLYFGILIGIAITILSVLLIVLFSNIQVLDNDFNSSKVLYQLFLFFLLALGHEVYFRGYIMQIFISANKIKSGVIISSVLFTLVNLIHTDSFNKPLFCSIIEIINILLLGYLLAITRISSKGIWMPIGINFAINFIQSSVFGFNNVNEKMDSILNMNIVDYTIFNGNGYCLESSISLTVITVGFIYLLK